MKAEITGHQTFLKMKWLTKHFHFYAFSNRKKIFTCKLTLIDSLLFQIFKTPSLKLKMMST